MVERSKFTVAPLFQDSVYKALKQVHPAEEKTEQNCRYRLDMSTPAGWVRLKQFTNGTLYIEATDLDLYKQVCTVIANLINTVSPEPSGPVSSKKPGSSSFAGSPRGKIHMDVPYIGTDESGKGDYFGPLVVAGVYTTPQTAQQLSALGVMDSKLLKDEQMKHLAADIQTLLGPGGFHIIEIGPKRYNELYDTFKKGGKNLNHLLAWGHAKVLEVLLEKHPECTHAIADQFGSEYYIQSQLQTRGRQIQLHQTPKAEANIGVAAASILARVRFIQKIKTLGDRYGVVLPLGAGPQVLKTARGLMAHHGPGVLYDVAKHHFKTTDTLITEFSSSRPSHQA